MRPFLLGLLLHTAFFGGLRADEGGLKRGSEPEKPSCHGTSVEFADSPVQAAKLATQQKKLVLVLHVSGHFEDPGFT
jgi:hypothetical protein